VPISLESSTAGRYITTNGNGDGPARNGTETEMHTNKITSIENARGYIEALVAAGKDFHFDDDPHEVIDYGTGKRVFTDEEAKTVRQRLDEMADLDWGAHECPLGYVLHLREVELHKEAHSFMEKHSKPDWETLSLDEWLACYGEELSDDVRRAGRELLDAFSEL
tara:strand:- start:255 stop:749 length:495 start_codon:yes stop_codon:yes gene_type:complete